MFKDIHTAVDFAVICFLLALAYGLSLLFHLDVLISVLLFLAVPALYLCYRKKKNYRKILLASVVLGLLGGMAYDFFAEYNDAYVVHYSNAFFNHHILGKTPVGDFIWAFLIPFSIIVHYEHFLDSERITRISNRFPLAIVGAGSAFLIVFSFLVLYPDSPRVPYGFFVIGAISVLPLVGLWFERRAVVLKLLITAAFFFVLNLVFEVCALSLRQ